MGTKLEGMDALVSRLESLSNEEELRAAMAKACALVERSAKQKAPKGNGELRRSITSEIKNDGVDMVGIVYTPLEYAPYVEFGTGLFAEEGGRKDVPWCYQDDEGNWHTTSGRHPHPFLRPALEENREEIMRLLKEGILNG